jgi:hypothetical protein
MKTIIDIARERRISAQDIIAVLVFDSDGLVVPGSEDGRRIECKDGIYGNPTLTAEGEDFVRTVFG